MSTRQPGRRAHRPTLSWAVVGQAIRERLDALGWTLVELAERSQVSVSIIREIRDHSIERQRTRHTLKVISLALGWAEDHLTTILLGHPPPPPPVLPIVDRTALARLSAIEAKLDECNRRLETALARIEVIIEHIHALVRDRLGRVHEKVENSPT